jgi:hypothetical protein
MVDEDGNGEPIASPSPGIRLFRRRAAG